MEGWDGDGDRNRVVLGGIGDEKVPLLRLRVSFVE
jgi:hypothetical protein